jgi:flagellar hook assembly protein FlgD
VLTIYDPLGRRVRTLVDADQGPGTYQAAWDGTDSKGRPAASGVYFVRLEGIGQSETRRMALIR